MRTLPALARLVLVCTTLLLVSCDRGNAPAPSAEPPDEVAAPVSPDQEATEAADVGAPSTETPEADAGPGCVEKCVRENQMRAEAIEKIRAECKQTCTDATN